MKKIVLILICLMFMGNVKALTEGFDDDVFYKCILKAANQEENLTDEQLSGIKVLKCDEKLTSTKGIEKLTSLEELQINVKDNFKEIDLNSNSKLKKLTIYGKGLKEINLTSNTLLEELDLSTTSISNIDLQNNTALKKLILSQTPLKTLNIDNLLGLEILNITESDISVNINKNNNLKELYIDNEFLGNVDLNQLSNLTKLYVLSNYGEVFYVKDNETKSLKKIIEDSSLNLKYKINFDLSKPIIDDSNSTDLIDQDLKVGDYIQGYLFTYGIKNPTLKINGEFKTINFDGNYVDAKKYMYLFINIKSDDYYIDEDNKIIYVGNDNPENVLDKIYLNKAFENVDYIDDYIEYNVSNDKLKIVYKNPGQYMLVESFELKNGGPSNLKCIEQDGKYYDKNGNNVSKETYFESCGVVENPKTGIILSLTTLIIFTILGIYILLKKNYLRKI